jgi:hypothetical protein
MPFKNWSPEENRYRRLVETRSLLCEVNLKSFLIDHFTVSCTILKGNQALHKSDNGLHLAMTETFLYSF